MAKSLSPEAQRQRRFRAARQEAGFAVVSIYLDGPTLRRLNAIRKREGLTHAGLITRWIRDHPKG